MKAPGTAVLLFGFILSAMFCGNGCVSIHQKEVEQVKTAAIIGFVARLKLESPLHSRGLRNELNAIATLPDLPDEDRRTEHAAQASSAYRTLTREMARSQGWAVKTLQEVTRDPAIMAYAQEEPKDDDKQTHGVKLLAPGIPSNAVCSKMEPEQLDGIYDALGVDALVCLGISFNGTIARTVAWKEDRPGEVEPAEPIPGTRAVYLDATLGFSIYKRGFPESIWTSTMAGIGVSTKGIIPGAEAPSRVDLKPLIADATAKVWKKAVDAYLQTVAEKAAEAEQEHSE